MRNTLTQEEIDDLAKEYLRLRDKAGKSKSNRVKAKFANFQNHIEIESFLYMELFNVIAPIAFINR